MERRSRRLFERKGLRHLAGPCRRWAAGACNGGARVLGFEVEAPVAKGTGMSVDLAALLDEMTPYVVSAVGAYGETVLAKEKAASLTVGVGLGLTQRIFGRREDDDDSIPDALAKVV